MITAQNLLYNFLRTILLSIFTVIGFFVVVILAKNFSENLFLLLLSQGGFVMFLTIILALADNYIRFAIDKVSFTNNRRAAYQTIISAILSFLLVTPFLVVYVQNPEQNQFIFWLLVAAYSFLNLLISRIWQIIYSNNEVKNIELYSAIGSLLILFILYTLPIDSSFLSVNYPVTIAGLIAWWFVGEFIIFSILSLFYYGLNSFYNVTFWHHLPPIKKPELSPRDQVKDQTPANSSGGEASAEPSENVTAV